MAENDGQQKQAPYQWSTPATPKKDIPVQAPKVSVPAAAVVGSNTGKYVGMVVVGIIAGMLVAWGWTASRNPSTTNSTATPTRQETSGPASSDASARSGVSVPDQNSDSALSVMSPQAPGTSVVIAKAIVDTPTWIVIYENKSGSPGNALGATLFFPGGQTGSVELLRATVSGQSYLAVKQVDDGDRKFELHGDQYSSEGGEVRWVTFEVR